MAYETLTVEGGLFPGDLLERVASGEATGWGQASFGAGQRLGEQVQASFSDTCAYWDAFQHRRQRSRESATSLTRGSWVIPLLETLGYELTYQQAALQAGGDPFGISHLAGNEPDAPPVHVVGLDQLLDQRDRGRSPHALVQEYLNRTDALWGLVTNGVKLRLLRNSARVTRPAYVEVDLQALIEGNRYNEFNLLYRLLHRSRLPHGGGDAQSCPLEQLYLQGIDEGGRVRDHLRDGVEAALRGLGTALVAHPDSQALREAGASGRLTDTAYYRQLLRLIYRLLFLCVVEERRLLFAPDAAHVEQQTVYSRYYSVARLRERCERHFGGDREGDLWQGLLATFRLFREDHMARELGLTALGGELFGEAACRDLEGAVCTNEALLTAMFRLSTFVDEQRVRRRVNYAGLDVEELGSVYESLLDYHPRITLGEPASFDLVRGSERKQTGSFYTPPPLVHELIESALMPVVQERLAAAKTKSAQEAALLGLKVCDTASGSGHFLLAAGRRIARELAKVRTEEEEPSPAAYRLALRDVVRSCLYAVDKNPLAVDLCKVALWLESYSTGMPLSFLDQHVKRGDSLVGVFDLGVLEQGVPDDAYAAVTGDDRQTASWFKKRNKLEKEGGQRSFDALLTGVESPRALAGEFAALASFDEHTTAEVAAKADLYAELRGPGTNWWRQKVACDLWTYAFFAPLTSADDPLVPTTETVQRYLAQPEVAYPQLVGVAMGAAEDAGFFHWPLEFPDVFAQGGFDVNLGNPPWERIKLQEQEFFAVLDLEIAQAPNAAARTKLIKALPQTKPTLARTFAAAVHAAEAQSKFVRQSGRFPLCGRGDVNTYSVFAELDRALLGPAGRAGFIAPTGIVTEETTKLFFRTLVDDRALISVYDFRNSSSLFAGVGHGDVRFSLVTIVGGASNGPSEFDLFLLARATSDLSQGDRHVLLNGEDIRLLNPNTHTCPMLRSQHDAELLKAIYRRVPVLIKEGPPAENPWGIKFLRMFDMSNDSGLFRVREQLEADGWALDGNVFHSDSARYLPLYEAKMLHHFDHRYGDYRHQPEGSENTHLPNVPVERLQELDYSVLPRYWVPEREVEARLAGRWDHGWVLGWHDVTTANNQRTLVASVLPRVGVGNSEPLMLPGEKQASLGGCLLAELSSFALDFIARLKAGGVHLNFFTVNQLPALPPPTFGQDTPWHRIESLARWVTRRALELTYTARDMQLFARDLGYDGPPFVWDEARRFLLRCELDAAFFHLYGVECEDVDYIMETFPIVKRRDEAAHGEYRTKRIILERYDSMQRAARGGEPYRTPLDPPPALGWSPSTAKAVV